MEPRAYNTRSRKRAAEGSASPGRVPKRPKDDSSRTQGRGNTSGSKPRPIPQSFEVNSSRRIPETPTPAPSTSRQAQDRHKPQTKKPVIGSDKYGNFFRYLVGRELPHEGVFVYSIDPVSGEKNFVDQNEPTSGEEFEGSDVPAPTQPASQMAGDNQATPPLRIGPPLTGGKTGQRSYWSTTANTLVDSSTHMPIREEVPLVPSAKTHPIYRTLTLTQIQQHLQAIWVSTENGETLTRTDQAYRDELRQSLQNYYDSLPEYMQNGISNVVRTKSNEGVPPGQTYVDPTLPRFIVPKTTGGKAGRSQSRPAPSSQTQRTTAEPSSVLGLKPTAMPLNHGPNFFAPQVEPGLKEPVQTPEQTRAIPPPRSTPKPPKMRTPPPRSKDRSSAVELVDKYMVPRWIFKKAEDFWFYHTKLGPEYADRALALLTNQEAKALSADVRHAYVDELINPKIRHDARAFNNCLIQNPFKDMPTFTVNNEKKKIFQIASDIHMERGGATYDFPLVREMRADFLVLAGDIGSLRNEHREKYLNWLKAHTAQRQAVFLTCGNTDFHSTGRTINEDYEEFDKLGEDPRFEGRLKTLNRDEYVVTSEGSGTIYVLGCTLWSNLDNSEEASLSNLSDFRLIKGNSFSAQKARYEKDLKYLQQRVAWIRSHEPKARILIVTHHAPSRTKISRRELDGNVMCSYFGSDILEGKDAIPGLGEGDVWVFGHTHLTTTWKNGGVEVHANQMCPEHHNKAYLNYTVSV
ncbi:hypothetical protein PVAG01_00360 [Phlyctema vagabunda]|uniref:Calcineurin-like phosphoesterase domain-containing protein n=1 Tax=Phlyctema vagabunda TaxID=108571 RepID=A0ABR4PUC9_9HELO